MIVNLQVNDENYALDVPARRSLTEVLRADIDLTGTKLACGEGFCGSCTVLLLSCSCRRYRRPKR